MIATVVAVTTTGNAIAGAGVAVSANVCAAGNCGKSSVAYTVLVASGVAGEVYTRLSAAPGSSRVAAVVPVAVVMNAPSVTTPTPLHVVG